MANILLQEELENASKEKEARPENNPNGEETEPEEVVLPTDLTKILSVHQLIQQLSEVLPTNPGSDKTVIGFVGYPNVGKSSTMNALIGAKKVTVSSTPGKTKHFQV